MYFMKSLFAEASSFSDRLSLVYKNRLYSVLYNNSWANDFSQNHNTVMLCVEFIANESV